MFSDIKGVSGHGTLEGVVQCGLWSPFRVTLHSGLYKINWLDFTNQIVLMLKSHFHSILQLLVISTRGDGVRVKQFSKERIIFLNGCGLSFTLYYLSFFMSLSVFRPVWPARAWDSVRLGRASACRLLQAGRLQGGWCCLRALEHFCHGNQGGSGAFLKSHINGFTLVITDKGPRTLDFNNCISCKYPVCQFNIKFTFVIRSSAFSCEIKTNPHCEGRFNTQVNY